MKVHINETGKSFSQTIAVEFEAIFDIPFGIIKLIREKYNDPDVFKKTWMNFDNYTLRSVLYERTTYNPILPALIVKDRNVAKDLYEQIVNDPDSYRRVIELSPTTSIYKFLISVDQISEKNFNMVNFTILCKNQSQLDWLNNHFIFPNARKILVEDFKFNLNYFDLLIMEQYENVLKYATACGKTVGGRTIWIPEFAYNMDTKETNKPSYEISVFVAETNKVSTYEPYINYTKPLG